MLYPLPVLRIRPAAFLCWPPVRQALLLALLGWLLAIATLVVTTQPGLPVSNALSLGALAELINLLTLLFMFWVVQCAHINHRSYQMLSVGLLLWLSGGAIDLLDEHYWQPPWLGLAEDGFRSSGMVLVVMGCLQVMRQVCDVYGQMATQAMSDELTRLPNRRYFRQMLNEQWLPGSAMLMIDLDHFKRINDDGGHDVGDRVLQDFARLLHAQCPAGGWVARLGGEEFAMLLRGDADEALRIAEAIRAAAAASRTVDDVQYSASIGLAVWQQGEAVGEMMRRADQALCRAKEMGRNRVEVA